LRAQKSGGQAARYQISYYTVIIQEFGRENQLLLMRLSLNR
jgi:hypothetical protein